MEEHRQFFRLKNNGEFHASADNESLEVVDISSTGILVVKKKLNFPNKGIIELNINHASMNLHYELLRCDKETMALVFKHEDEIDTLFGILKKLRDEQRTHHGSHKKD